MGRAGKIYFSEEDEREFSSLGYGLIGNLCEIFCGWNCWFGRWVKVVIESFDGSQLARGSTTGNDDAGWPFAIHMKLDGGLMTV